MREKIFFIPQFMGTVIMVGIRVLCKVSAFIELWNLVTRFKHTILIWFLLGSFKITSYLFCIKLERAVRNYISFSLY